ncbi:MAG: hypothetical protein KJ703_01695 [Alphaproteobacteria bacterium]|nr:hypothetical protein [Alphaproteobacteria bacterium]MBU1755697.1 hypothetical protein [Alphaproteobacteria bacterium]
MRHVLKSLAFALALTGIPASAADPEQKELTSDKERAAAQEVASEPKQICRRVAIETGSRQRQRLCMTQEQWREFNRGN